MKPFCLLVLVIVLSAAASRAQGPPPALGNYLDYPVYYELNDEPLLPRDENLRHLHDNVLTLRHFPPVDVSDFNWADSKIDDYSWWIQVEELRFLLPFIGSDRPEDRSLVKRWFESWAFVQRLNPSINHARWGEPMTAAYRGMVLVYFLKKEKTRPRPDDDLINKLRAAILEHQEFLAKDQHFDSNSNHGMVESLGLLEVTRVFPDADIQRLGLDRMLRIVRTSVSERGVHMEHSPVYHFVFLDWVDRYVRYLDSLPFLGREPLEKLFDCRRGMLEAVYHLTDHKGAIAQIGDSDSVVAGERYPHLSGPGDGAWTPVLFDEKSGYAIYKGDRSSGDRRYVVFANQNAKPKFRYHYHDDVLSVLFSYDGETLLGDSGKYEYNDSKERRFFVSPPAHNTIFPMEYLRTASGYHSIFVTDSTEFHSGPRATSFYGRVRHSSAYVERTVNIPGRGGAIVVEDVLRWPPVKTKEGQISFADVAPRYSAMVWNIGQDVVSIDTVETATAGEFEWSLTSVSGRKFRLHMEIDGGDEGAYYKVEVKRGNRLPMLGWYSPALFVMRPRPTILVTLRPERMVRVVTRIEPVEASPFALRILLRGY